MKYAIDLIMGNKVASIAAAIVVGGMTYYNELYKIFFSFKGMLCESTAQERRIAAGDSVLGCVIVGGLLCGTFKAVQYGMSFKG